MTVSLSLVFSFLIGSRAVQWRLAFEHLVLPFFSRTRLTLHVPKGLYWVLLGFTGFYRVVPVLTGFYWVLSGFYWVSLGIIGFHWV